VGRGHEGEEGVGQTPPHVLKHLLFLVMKSSGCEMLGKGKRGGEKEKRGSTGEEGVGQSTERGMTRSGTMIEGREEEKEKGWGECVRER